MTARHRLAAARAAPFLLVIARCATRPSPTIQPSPRPAPASPRRRAPARRRELRPWTNAPCPDRSATSSSAWGTASISTWMGSRFSRRARLADQAQWPTATPPCRFGSRATATSAVLASTVSRSARGGLSPSRPSRWPTRGRPGPHRDRILWQGAALRRRGRRGGLEPQPQRSHGRGGRRALIGPGDMQVRRGASGRPAPLAARLEPNTSL